MSELIAPSFFEVHRDIKEGKHTHYMLNGGRGSGKSSFVAVEIVLLMMKNPRLNAVVTRKTGTELRTSVYAQVLWAIEALGVSQYWRSSISPLTITLNKTGQRIIFRGMDDAHKSKSIKFNWGYCGIVWYEELDQFEGMEEIRISNQSLIRGGEKFYSFYTYNPPMSITNWVNVEAQLTRPDRLVHRSDYRSVPRSWLGEPFILEAEMLREVNLLAYNHEYLGEVTGTGGEIFRNVKLGKITDEEIKEMPVVRRGLDFGFAIDPACYVVCGYDRKKKSLKIYHEIYKTGLSNYKLGEAVRAENKGNDLVYADCAEPKSISELVQYGIRVAGVKKGRDSIDYGIKFLQDLNEIIIDDTRCPETAREFLQYEHERDSYGNFRDGYPDKNNHSIDAVRYALNFECLNHRKEKITVKKQYNFDFERPKPEQPYLGGKPTKSYIDYMGG